MLILDAPTTWPPHLTEQLNNPKVIGLIRQFEFIEDLEKYHAILSILEKVDEYAATTDLAAYHCSKQLPDRPFWKTGLRPLNFEEHHAEMREVFRSHPAVSTALFSRIDAGLDKWQKNHTGKREHMLWFCIDRPLALSFGTEDFFQYFGGESVYRGFANDPEVLHVLEEIGEPVVVEARISSADLKTFAEFPLGRTLVSYFAKSVNPEFNIESREGYILKSVLPEDIVNVHTLEKFAKSLR